ncbi:MAG: hypothetical protein ACC657_02130 [Thiohalomonadales bacterium]
MFYQQGSVSRVTLITLASLAILITLAILFLPSGFSNDVSKIGNGTKVAVFAFNNGTTDSMDMMNLMEQVRSSYSDQIEFLAVSISAPIGQKFLKDYNVEQSTLVLFRADGSIVDTLYATNNEMVLRQTLDRFKQL